MHHLIGSRPGHDRACSLGQMLIAILALITTPAWLHASGLDAQRMTLFARDFGAVGDGQTDDGPAILAMLDAARAHNGPTQLRFGTDRTYRVETGDDGYLFRLENVNDLRIDGRGSTFLLSPELRMLHAQASSDIVVRNLDVDFDPPPFVEGNATAVNAGARWVEVTLDAPALGDAAPGPPTNFDDEQAFFAKAWFDGPYEVQDPEFYFVSDAVPVGEDARRWRVTLDAEYDFDFARVVTGETRFTLPVAGFAHRVGPGHLFFINENQNVLIEDVEVWSAPWFAYGVFQNEGDIVFRRAHVRPKPFSGRLTSSWRDAFHIKHNRGDLLMESCRISGCHDDAIHIAAHSSRIINLSTEPGKIFIRQVFPLRIASFRPGDEVSTYDPVTGLREGPFTVLAVEGNQETIIFNGEPFAPILTLTLDELPAVTPGETVLWNDTGSNPNVTIRDCVVDQSCRFRGPMTIEDSAFRSFVWFYGDAREAPVPSSILVRCCSFQRGRGNPTQAINLRSFVDPQPEGTEPAMLGFRMEQCVVRGDFRIRDSRDVEFATVLLDEPGAVWRLNNVRNVLFDGCEISGFGPVTIGALDVQRASDANEIVITP